jgi:CelD/BcsL family acetyltransferase involved in cellulose biosynthesis
MRRSLRKAGARLADDGPVRIETATTQTLDHFSDALFRLHLARWESLGSTGVLDQEKIRSFHRAAMGRMFAGGRLRFYATFWRDRIIAVVHALTHTDSTYAYLGGFEPGLEQYSSGSVLLAHAIEQAIAEGKRLFDFLRGAERYKYSWGAVDRTTYRIQLRHDDR